ncbi:hypothetical protein Celaphus_00011421, partial [Cervus elaphus hippelaphus]
MAKKKEKKNLMDMAIRLEFLDVNVASKDGIITVLLTSINAIEAYSGANGIPKKAKQGSLLTDSSTIDPTVWKDLAKEVEKMGAIFRALRICYNILLAIGMIGTADAMNLGIRLGPDPKLLAKILNGGFRTTLMAKDLGLAHDSNVSTNTPIFLGSQAHQICVDDACKGLLKERLLVRVPVSMRRGDILSLSTF